MSFSKTWSCLFIEFWFCPQLGSHTGMLLLPTAASVPIMTSSPHPPLATSLVPASSHSEVLTASLSAHSQTPAPIPMERPLVGMCPGEVWKRTHRQTWPLRKREAASQQVTETCLSLTVTSSPRKEKASIGATMSLYLHCGLYCFGAEEPSLGLIKE